MTLTAAEARAWFSYDPDTGVIRWRQPRRRIKVGDEAGCLNNAGYRVIRFNYQLYYAHQIAITIMTGEFPESETDHQYGVGDDNRWIVIRPASSAQNKFNRRVRKDSTTGLKGVYPQDKHGFCARITYCRIRYWLGSHKTAEAAARAYDLAAIKHFGEFARTNFPREEYA